MLSREKTGHREPPIVVDKYVSGMGVSLAMKGIAVSATKLEDGRGAVYVSMDVREQAMEILRQQGFIIEEVKS